MRPSDLDFAKLISADDKLSHQNIWLSLAEKCSKEENLASCEI
jgi:hypothetical protein